MTPSDFDVFVADQSGCIDQLTLFVGGHLRNSLDCTRASLPLLDRYLANLRRDPKWYASPLYEPISKNMEVWLATRVAYYLAAVLQRDFACTWLLCTDADSSMRGFPVLDFPAFRISPMHIAFRVVREGDRGGLVGAVEHVEQQLASQ